MKKYFIQNSELKEPTCFFIVLALFWITLDQGIKAAQRHFMETGQSIPLIKGVFHLTSTENTGAAFSLFEGKRWLFLVVAGAVILIIIAIVIHERPRSFYPVVGFSLLIAGTVGNFIDRAIFGLVFDIFDFRLINFAVFNVADIGITFGVIFTLLWVLFFSKDDDEREAIIENTVEFTREAIDELPIEEVVSTISQVL